MAQPQLRYEFGDFILVPRQQSLWRRGTDVAIPLSGKAFDTLVYLVQHPGEALDKEDLLRALWPGVIVEENSLAQVISTLRQVLGETRGENRYIATIARKGYRFVAPVSHGVAADAVTFQVTPTVAPSPPPRLLAGIAVFLLVIAAMVFLSRRNDVAGPVQTSSATQTLAILPFKPLLPAHGDESLQLGMTESLIAHLGHDRARSISPLSSVRRYADEDRDAIEAGRELGVQSVLEGSLQRSGERLRVSVRLLRVTDGQQLWAQTFDQDFTTIFDVQDAIAARITEALPAYATAGHSRPAAAQTRDPEAYSLYTSGRFSWMRQTEISLISAIAFFERAIARDPNYALAYTGLADSYALLGVLGIRAPREVFPKARHAAEQALSISPDLASAHSALGHVLAQYDHDWLGAVRAYNRAFQLDPRVALNHHRRALLYAMQGDTEGALAASARAQQLEPLWLQAKAAACTFLYYARRYDESIALAKEVLALDERVENARGALIRDLIATGDYVQAIAELDRRPLLVPGSNAFRAQALALSGQTEAARAELERVLDASTQRYVPAYDFALIYAALGDHGKAFRSLENAMQDRSTLLVFLAREPMFDALHADPRFDALVQRIGILGREL